MSDIESSCCDVIDRSGLDCNECGQKPRIAQRTRAGLVRFCLPCARMSRTSLMASAAPWSNSSKRSEVGPPTSRPKSLWLCSPSQYRPVGLMGRRTRTIPRASHGLSPSRARPDRPEMGYIAGQEFRTLRRVRSPGSRVDRRERRRDAWQRDVRTNLLPGLRGPADGKCSRPAAGDDGSEGRPQGWGRARCV